MGSFYTANPSLVTAPFIRKFWGMRNRLPEGVVHTQKIVPTGLSDITFFLCDKGVVSAAGSETESHFFISGTKAEPYEIRVSGEVDILACSLLPGALTAFTGIAGDEFGENVPAGEEVFGSDAGNMADALATLRDFQSRIRFLEELLRDKIFDYHALGSIERVRAGILTLDGLSSDSGIAGRASRACLSRRQYERLFKKNIGLSPKKMMQIVRFQRAIYAKECRPSLNLTDIAYSAGYYDQSHMIREFKKLSGMIPKEFFGSGMPVSDLFS